LKIYDSDLDDEALREMDLWTTGVKLAQFYL